MLLDQKSDESIIGEHLYVVVNFYKMSLANIKKRSVKIKEN